jgi:hypothetical protein
MQAEKIARLGAECFRGDDSLGITVSHWGALDADAR